MRCYEKKRLLDSIDLLYKAADDLKNNRTYSEKTEILQLSQQMAITIGENIEEHCGCDTRTVRLLEELCEILYKAFNNLDATEHYATLLKLHIEKIEKSITDEIKCEKLKILFLPYKLSMWTAMESIWEAAMKDDECHVSVVPIPYYNIADKDNITMSYEGMEYPKEIDIIDYKTNFGLDSEYVGLYDEHVTEIQLKKACAKQQRLLQYLSFALAKHSLQVSYGIAMPK